MAWALMAVGLLVAVVVPAWGWKPLASALPEPSGSPWVPIVRLGNAADVVDGRLRRVSLISASVVWVVLLAFLGGAVWQLVTTGAVNLGNLLSDIADAGVPLWLSVTGIAVGFAGALTNRIVLIMQATAAVRALNISGSSVVLMVVSAWVWARTVTPAIREQQAAAERERIAGLGPEPAPVSRFALPLEAAADRQESGTSPVPPPPAQAPSTQPLRTQPATNPPPPAAATPASAISTLPPPAAAQASTSAQQPAHTERRQWVLRTGNGERLPIPGAHVTVGRAGRGATADVLIADSTRTMSKSHAELTWDGNQWWITDLGSTNGTHLYGSNSAWVGLRPHEPVAATAFVRFGEFEASLEFSAEENNA